MITAESLAARLLELRAEHQTDAEMYERIEQQLASVRRNMDARHGAIVELEALLVQSEQPNDAIIPTGATP